MYSGLSIASTGTIQGAPGASGNGPRSIGGAGLYSFQDATVYNSGVIIGGQGGAEGRGGYGVVFTLGSIENAAVINGGRGGNGATSGAAGGRGGIGVFMVNYATLINSDTIVGGAGGVPGPALQGVSSLQSYAGAGGVGVLMGKGTLVNSGVISGGAGGMGQSSTQSSGGDGGEGGIGLLSLYIDTLFTRPFTLNNSGEIRGGAGGRGGSSISDQSGAGGAGGLGLIVTGAGPLTLGGTIIGGGGGSGGSSNSDQTGAGGAGGGGVSLFSGPGGGVLTVTNSGVILGGVGGVGAVGGVGGTGASVSSAGGGILLTNLGSITGGGGGGGASDSGAAGDGLILELGTVVNAAHGLISGRYGLVVALSGTLSGGSTITNFGTIEGATGVSVALHDASDRLIAEAGSTWIGAVQGGGGTLELATGNGAISGLGAIGSLSGAETMTFRGFAHYAIDSGTNWTLSGVNSLSSQQGLTLAKGATLTIIPGKLTVAGSLSQEGDVTIKATEQACPVIARGGVWAISAGATLSGSSSQSRIIDYGLLLDNAAGGGGTVNVITYDAGTIEAAGGTFVFAAGIAGTGILKIDAGARLEALSNVSRTLTVSFNGPSATMVLAQPKHFAATISGLASTDTIDLAWIKATGASINAADQLVIVDGATIVASLQLTGAYKGATFQIGADGGGGTNITMTTAAAPSPRRLAEAMAGLNEHGGQAMAVHAPEGSRSPVLARPWGG